MTQSWNSAIQQNWSGQFGPYNVTTTVTSGSDNQITVPSGDGRAYVMNVGGNSGVWPELRPGWTAAHEAGHLLGLRDHYDYNTIQPDTGWEHDIMGGRDKPPTENSILELIKVHSPHEIPVGFGGSQEPFGSQKPCP